jgi:polynucleotide 5'-hydroxyl-kinase GRC3/NOL9
MTVLKGEITFLGATMTAADEAYTIYAPSSHSLPVIRCLGTELDSAEIVLRQHKSGLESLQTLSPLFAKIWNDGKGPFGSECEYFLRYRDTTTYQIVRPMYELLRVILIRS